jgi:hypothetical protein
MVVMRSFLGRTGSLLLLAAALAAAGCGSDRTAGTGGGATTTKSTTGGTGGTDGGTTVVTCTGQPSTLALTGTWAAYGQLSVSLLGVPGGAITICPADQVGAATLLLLITIQQDATDPTKLDQIQASLCSVAFPTVTALVGTCDPTSQALVSTQLLAPQALIDALPKVAAAMATGTLTGTAPGATMTVEPLDVVVGTSAAGTALPSWNTTASGCESNSVGMTKTCEATCVSDCPSMRDDDGDGYPGVTIQVCGDTPGDTKSGVKCNAAVPNTPGATLQGQAFIDLEVNPTFTGAAKSSCEIAGTVDSKVLYNVVGADVYLAGAAISVSSAIDSLPTFQVDAAASKFRMVRIDGQYGAPNWMVDPTQQSAACATLNMRVNEL